MAGFLSNIFGGGAEREAANANRAAYGQYGTQANGFLDTGLHSSVGALTNASNTAGGFLGQNSGLYGDLRNTGTGILDAGRAGQLNSLSNIPLQNAGASYAPLDDLAKKYGAGSSLYLDSLGVNGAGGNANAVNAFHTGPGYEFTRDSGLDALNRRRAAAGMLGSGNADADAIKFGTGLADQTYGSWQDRLAGFVNPELSATNAAASGRAGAATSANALELARAQAMSGVQGNDTLARLGLEQGITQGQAGVNTGQANNALGLGNSLGSLYNQDAQNRTNVAGTVTGGNVSANNLQAQGEAQGSRNLLNAGLGLATLVAGMPGGVPGMGAGGSFGALGGGGGGGLSSMMGPSRTSTLGFNPLSGAFSGL